MKTNCNLDKFRNIHNIQKQTIVINKLNSENEVTVTIEIAPFETIIDPVEAHKRISLLLDTKGTYQKLCGDVFDEVFKCLDGAGALSVRINLVYLNGKGGHEYLKYTENPTTTKGD